MMRRSLLLAAAVLGVTACTEKLTSPADCPALCPGGSAVFIDTVITATIGLDSSYAGYVANNELLSLLIGNGGAYGNSRGIIRFVSRGDSAIIADTSRALRVDSAVISISLQNHDTTATNTVLEMYRLPLSIDSMSTVAQVDAAMTPGNLLQEFSLPPTLRRGTLAALFTGAELAKLSFVPSDSTRLAIGIRVRSDGPTGVRIGTAASGVQGALVTWYTTATAVTDTILRKQLLTRVTERNSTIRTAQSSPPSADLLAVGGSPVARSFVRFTLPPSLKDSATIIRATLELTLDSPLFGIPADTSTLIMRPVLTSLGPKSPVTTDVFEGAFLLPGLTSISAEVASLVRLWQGVNGLPPIIRLQLGEEGGTFIAPAFRSTRSATGIPRLRITFRRGFAFEGF